METDAGDYAIGDNKMVGGDSKGKTAAAAPSVTMSFGIPPQLEPFVLLAKSARGASAANLVGQATAAPGLFVFSELLQLASIQELAKHDQFASIYELLEIFAYGTWADYLAKKDHLPPLKPAQATKLKHLTILSLSAHTRVIPYSVLLSTLDLADIPALEDLLIDGFYSNVFKGRLDQKESRLEVTSGVGRDVRPDDAPPASSSSVAATPSEDAPPSAAPATNAMEIDTATASTSAVPLPTQHQAPSMGTLTASLHDWLATINVLLASLSQHLATIQSNSINDVAAQKEHEQAVSAAVLDVQAKQQAETGAQNGAGGGPRGKGPRTDEGGSSAGAGGDWSGGVISGIKGKLFGGGGASGSGSANANAGKEDMDVDSGDGGGGGASQRSPQGGGRTRKRGRM